MDYFSKSRLLKMRVLRFATASVIFGMIFGLSAADNKIEATARGAIVKTKSLEVQFKDGTLISLHNKLTDEEYLDTNANMGKILPHLPSGLGTQSGDAAMAAAEKLHHWPWWEFPNNEFWPNQHFPDAKSQFDFKAQSDGGGVLTYRDLSDGKNRFPDEIFTLELSIDPSTEDLLVTPGGTSPRPGVYSSALTFAPLAAAVTAEAPVGDGVRITRDNTGPVLWRVKWPDYWDFGFIALNGWKKGAIGIWSQDQKVRFYKSLLYLNNTEGLSFSFSMMEIPPFEGLKTAHSPLPWRIQAFDKSWSQAAERFRQWRDANVKIAPRPEFTKHISFMASISGPQKNWLEHFLRYTSPWQNHAAAFLCSVRKQQFDHNHADNTPVDTFAADTKAWRDAGTYGMAYLQPMIMWGPFPPEDKQSEREKLARKLHAEADTRSAFQKDPNTVITYVDQHHLGHAGWQRWFLDWVKEWCKDYGAQGIYHDQSYPCPTDRRGLAVNGMTSPEGMADYFYKAATENPGTFHGTEKVTEANIVGVSNSIGSGYHWGTAPYMRMARAFESSPVSAALSYPLSVPWAFIRLRGESTWDLRERYMCEARAEIAGAIDGPMEVDPKWYPMLCNTPWLDRTRDVAFLQHGLRPYFPADYSRDILSYFKGEDGAEFNYEKMSWGSRFVNLDKSGSKTMLYGIATGVPSVSVTDAGIAGWVVYNDQSFDHTWNQAGPTGLNPEHYYILDPKVTRPAVYFSTVQGYGPSFYESYVEDCGYNEYMTFMKLRPIERLISLSNSETVRLHSQSDPVAVYVNGKKITVKRDAKTGAFDFAVPSPGNVIVIHKAPPASLAELPKASLRRVTETGKPIDYYHTENLKLDTVELDALKRPALTDAAVPVFGFQYGGRKHIHVPVMAPAESKGGTLRLHIVPDRNKILERVDLNFQPMAIAEGQMSIPATLDIPLAAGEVKLLSLRTGKIIGGMYGTQKSTTCVGLEWIEKPAK